MMAPIPAVVPESRHATSQGWYRSGRNLGIHIRMGEYLMTLTLIDFPELETLSIAVTNCKAGGAFYIQHCGQLRH